MTSRYVTYGIQFVNSMFIAIALGPIYLAVWGFINLILQYIAQFNWGVPYSLNVLLSINKNDSRKVNELLSASLLFYLILAVIVALVFLSFHYLSINIGEKYSFDKYSFVVVLIAICTHFNTIFTNYFRVFNRLIEIIFFQSVVPLSMLIAICFESGEKLLQLILWIMLVGQILSLLIYIYNSHLRMLLPTMDSMRILLRKGMFLFVYNTCFYLILLSTRTVVSVNYQVEEFGFFTFSFTLANTIMLLFDSFSFLIYPKTINRFNKASQEDIIRILDLIRVNYITSIHFAMYIFLLSFPVLILLFPQYNSIFKCFAFMSLTVVFYGNCFAFSSLLTAHGKEQLLGGLAFVALIVNIVLALLFANVFKLGYEYIILSTMISYLIYNMLLAYFSYRMLDMPCNMIVLLKDNLLPRLFIPFFLTLLVVIADGMWYIYWGIFIMFIIMNWRQLLRIKDTAFQILRNPSFINI